MVHMDGDKPQLLAYTSGWGFIVSYRGYYHWDQNNATWRTPAPWTWRT